MGIGGFADRLVERIRGVGSPLCVGLDPVLDRIPDAAGTPGAALERFSSGVIGAVSSVAACIKIQSACYERYGSAGFAAMESAAARAHGAGMLVIYDAKRGDIGISAEHYAAAARALNADAVTLSPYMGPSTIKPFIEAGFGVFALVRTSNPDSDRIQSIPTEGGATVAERVGAMIAEMGADRVGSHGLSTVGAVVGATKAEDGKALRAAMPDQPFLVPGIGAQGGVVGDLAPLIRPKATDAATTGVIATASRSVIYAEPSEGERWDDAVARSATALADELAALAP